MQLGSINYSAPGVIRLVQDGADVAAGIGSMEFGQADTFTHDLTVINVATHGLLAAVNTVRGLRDASDHKDTAGKNLLLAFGDGIASLGYLGAANGMGWPSLAVAGVGSLVSNLAQMSNP